MAAMEPKRLSLRPYAKSPDLDLQGMTEDYLTYGHRIEQYITDTARLTWKHLDDGGHVVFEGAQGTLLDIDHGTYPFVTSLQPGRRVGRDRHRRRAEGPRRDLGRDQGVRDARRRRPVPDRARRRARRHHARGRRRVRHHDRPRAPRRLDRPRRAALRGAAEHAHPPRRHQARRALAASGRCASARATAAPTRRASTSSRTTSPCCTTRAASTRSCPAGTRTSRSAGRRTTSRRPPATTSPTCRTSWASRSR